MLCVAHACTILCLANRRALCDITGSWSLKSGRRAYEGLIFQLANSQGHQVHFGHFPSRRKTMQRPVTLRKTVIPFLSKIWFTPFLPLLPSFPKPCQGVKPKALHTSGTVPYTHQVLFCRSATSPLLSQVLPQVPGVVGWLYSNAKFCTRRSGCSKILTYTGFCCIYLAPRVICDWLKKMSVACNQAEERQARLQFPDLGSEARTTGEKRGDQRRRKLP